MSTIQKKIIIIGAGISGLTSANELIANGYKKKDILVLEESDVPGGLIKTTIENGYSSEWGPEGLRGSSENSSHIFDLAGIDSLPVTEHAKIRYLVHKGKLQKVPSGPLSAIFTPLIPFFGKLRILKEPFVKAVEEDESMSDFILRRLGKGILPIVDAFVSGVYGGDHTLLSTKYGFPVLKEMEELGGSIIRGGMKRAKIKKKERKARGEVKDKTEKPFLLTSKDGMIGVINALAEKVDVRYNSQVNEVNPLDNNTIEISSSDTNFTCDKLIIATGVNSMDKIKIKDIEFLPNVRESLVTVVTLGFDQGSFNKEVVGYGFLSPSKENTFCLGMLFGSRLFPNHAPEDKIMLRCFVGGIRQPERAKLSEDDMVKGVMGDVKQLLDVTADPEYVSIQSHAPKGIPQILLGHEKKLEWRDNVEKKYPNIFLTGVGWKSIACDGIITELREIVKKIGN